MKIALCTIAREENVYINEWVQHHLNIGFDHIFIYDNNLPDYPYVGDSINANIDKVTIIPFIKKTEESQQQAYYDCYKTYSINFDWMAFFDVDEFLMNNDSVGIKTRLEKITADNVVIPWKIYTWSGKFSRDVSSSVVDDFTEYIPSQCDVVKSIVRTNLPHILNRKWIDVHVQDSANSFCDILGNPLYPSDKHVIRFPYFANFGGCRTMELNHYWSKSLDELIKYKCHRQYFNRSRDVKSLIQKYCKPEDLPIIMQYFDEKTTHKE